MDNKFETVLQQYINHIDSLMDTAPLLMVVVAGMAQESKKKLDDYVTKNEIIHTKLDDSTVQYHISPEMYPQFRELEKRVFNTSLSSSLLSKNFIVSLVSQYDAFIGDIIRTIFLIKPEILNNSQKSLTFSEILDFESLEKAKEFIVEKEVESVLRESHSYHVTWLEGKLNMTLTKGLDIWPKFIEITERRNLFVHCNGIISTQYLNNCKKYGVESNQKCNINDKLGVNPKYLREAYKCFYEMGVKLTHVIWRKLKPDEREKADMSMVSICYELIKQKEYTLAINILEFMVNSVKKFHSENIKILFIINLAQAYKWSSNDKKLKDLIDSITWSAYRENFRLAKAVLIDDFEDAGNLMRRIGEDGDVNKVDYKEWPLFKEFRKTDIFKDAFSEIFGEPYIIIETSVNASEPQRDIESCDIKEIVI